MNYKSLGSVLVTGGTGSFGRSAVKRLLTNSNVKRVVVYSRDELKQFEMQNEFQSDKLFFTLGDVRDFERVLQATSDIDVVIHAAAMKQIPAAENNPMEAIKTNILGASNIIDASIQNGVSRVIALSTDKAANPANLYGATKLCSDRLFIAGNKLSSNTRVRFSVVRYGNVLGSRGSVVPFFVSQKQQGFFTITDERMTRFWLTLDQGVSFVLRSLEVMRGGEIFVPKIPSFKVTDVAKALDPNLPLKVTGIRPGEKLHEVMITPDDALNTLEYEDMFVIRPPFATPESHPTKNGIPVTDGFSYASDNNPEWLSESSFLALLNSAGIKV